ncbi:MAG: nicotinate phosphoribosyltransferase [Deinococcota bacterium]
MNLAQQRTAEGFLFTDMYQLTMAQLYFQQGLHERPAQFDHFFRDYPNYGTHRAGFCINAGMGWFLDWLDSAHIRDEDIDVLKQHRDAHGKRTFDDDFLIWLRKHGDFSSLTIQAVPEGRVVHPQTPITVVEGPLAIAQIVETALLAQLNYQTLIATKAARIRESCEGAAVLEFGVRRSHDRGGNAGTRAALIGGADFSSNVGISAVLGYPAKGTHAHSMVQVFVALGLGELAAFQAYADLYPDNCLLLVDTLDTLGSGLPNAITVFEKLRAKGHEPVGVRIDSGDLAYLSIQAAKMLNDAGFPDTQIVLSSNLDELVIWQILTQIRQEAASYGVHPESLANRLVYGVGTRLITSEGDSSLGGVYKLVAISPVGLSQYKTTWKPAIKVSNSPAKTPNPGDKRVWRVYRHDNSSGNGDGRATADVLALSPEQLDASLEAEGVLTLQHYADVHKRRKLAAKDVRSLEPLHELAYQHGTTHIDKHNLDAIRARRDADLTRLDSGVKRLVNPHIYHVSLTPKLWQLKQDLLESLHN